ncbi:MAG: GAF domain-containing protein [Dethiobacteria bacterium]|nr:GAF domain-containing protein [Bacillota bacterium]
MEIVEPFMKHIDSLVRGSGFIVVYTDQKMNILSTLGDKPVLEKGKETNFIVGANWHEKYVGTNAPCLALIEGKPIQVIGAEHFCQTHHPSTCSAAPIRDPDGNIIGVLDMTGDYTKARLVKKQKKLLMWTRYW